MTLVCDGTSDRAIIDIVSWIMSSQYEDVSHYFSVAREVVPARQELSIRLKRAVELYPSDLVLCHRDAEAMTHEVRLAEVEVASTHVDVAVVPVVPVRMIEAWLLFNEHAIRSAASNRTGNVKLALPSARQVESVSDPKVVLFDALRAACELTGRRLRKFNVQQARSRVSTHVSDFAPLRVVPAFAHFEQRFKLEIERLQRAWRS
jgi:hypothetical protein